MTMTEETRSCARDRCLPGPAWASMETQWEQVSSRAMKGGEGLFGIPAWPASMEIVFGRD